MIHNYKIKKENNEEILYLYLDFNYEFGLDFNIKNKYSNMKTKIIKYIKKNKIKFNGEKIALVVGGMVLSFFLIIENPNVNDKFDIKYVDSSINLNSYVEVAEVIEETVEENNNIHQEISEIRKEETKNKKVNDDINQMIKLETKIETKEKIDEPNIVNNKEQISQEQISQEQQITVYRNNGSIISLPISEYLIGVVGAEMPASFNIEALKVQAVISRTYTLKSLEIERKLTDTVSTQSYKDNDELRKNWGKDYDKYYNKIKEAVDSTKDMAIYYDNKLIDAVFFSTSNGKTEDSKYVWKNEIPYLKSVDSSWDKNTSPYFKNIEKDLDNVLELLGTNSKEFTILSRNESNRVLEVKVGDKIFSGVEFRNLLGLRSSDFDLEVVDNKLNITTRGYGHGVGVSQYGANEMTKLGYNYDQIIKYYYKDVEIY